MPHPTSCSSSAARRPAPRPGHLSAASGDLMTKRLGLACLAASLLAAVSTAHAATTLEREFRYPAGRISLAHNADGTTQVVMSGMERDFTPGHPDRPLAAEQVVSPAGHR